MSQKNPALQLFNDLWADVNEANFIWQVAALLACLGLAAVIARWWRGRHTEGAGRFGDAS